MPTKKSKMNRTAALLLDRKGGFYADESEETGDYGVFGTESGFCYFLYGSRQEAKDTANTMSMANDWNK
jgi:hypothetical protein